MRRSLLAAALLLGSFAAFLPHTATADHCGTRILVLTGAKATGTTFDPGLIGCTAGHQNTNRIMPGADQALIRVRQASGQPYPVGGSLTTDSKTTELDSLKPNADPEMATLWEQTVSIGATTKVVVKVLFADGAEQTVTYTR